MTDLVNPNSVSLCSEDFSFLVNPNVDKKDRYIVIVSNMFEFPAKGIFSYNQFRAVDHLYDDKPRKLGEKKRLVTTDGRDSLMFISYCLSYLTAIFPTYEDIYSYPKVPLTPAG